MRILVVGKTGQLAIGLANNQGGHSLTFAGRDAMDQSDPVSCQEYLAECDVDAVINAAAWTDVDGAETAENAATVVNGATPTALAKTARDLGIPIIHVSTDYVFDGLGETPWRPSDKTNPLNAYGRSKLAGEVGVAASGAVFAILRTSWVVSVTGKNFVKTMLALGATRDKLTVVADQHGAPTPADDLAMACLRAAEVLVEKPELSGIYHFAGAPDTTWAGFARAIFETAGMKVVVEDVPSTVYARPAKRPMNSRLDCSSFTAAFGLERPDWRVGLTGIIKDLKA
jgi:dTDP-4-dehydrorhamnose reductase